MSDQEATPTDEDAQATESADEASSGEDAPETEVSTDDATAAAPTPKPSDDPVIAGAQAHLEGVDMAQERAAVDKITKDL